MDRNTTRPRSTPTPTRSATPPAPPPRTIGQLRALIATALAIVEHKGPLSRLARRDLAALLRAALRYKRRRSDA